MNIIITMGLILYGTDTMGASAGAVSYLLENLGKPVGFTGSMKEAEKEGSGGPSNLIDCIHVAARSGYDLPLIPEVFVCFAKKIFRGVCAVKVHANDMDAFDSPGHELLGNITEDGFIEICKNRLLPFYNVELKTHLLGDKSLHQLWLPFQNGESLRRIVLKLRDSMDGILLYGLDELHSETKAFKGLKDVLSDILAFYMSKVNRRDLPPRELMYLPRLFDFDQVFSKIQYVVSRTDNPALMRKLYESNLRGEGYGEIVREEEILSRFRENLQ